MDSVDNIEDIYWTGMYQTGDDQILHRTKVKSRGAITLPHTGIIKQRTDKIWQDRN